MSSLKITPIDDVAANDGAWFSYLGVRLKIARANNERFRVVFKRLSKPYRLDIQGNSLDEETAKDILCESLADAILVDWDKETFPGKLEYSKKTAKQLLMDDPDCRDFVVEVSKEAENFYRAETEEVEGNS